MDVNEAFDSTAKVLFGEGIGDLKSFEGYLKEMMMPYMRKKSFISGKEVTISNILYPEDAKFISQDEMGGLKFPPLNVNEIKDIDSLFRAVEERTVYCGNKVFGKNYEVKDVDNCVNSSGILYSHNVHNVKHGAYLSYVREAECVFGLGPFPHVKFSMRSCEGIDATRCFETYYTSKTSDSYYTFNCIGCQNIMFSFNQRSKRNVIGNLELPPDRFEKLKRKLLSEMADELKRKKRLFSIADIAFYGRDKADILAEQVAYDSPVPKKVEDAFRATTKLVLGQEHKDIKKFGPWLSKRIIGVKKVKGAFGNPTFKQIGLPVIREIPADRLVTLKEGEKCGEMKMELREGEGLAIADILQRVSKFAYFTVEFVDGQNQNCVDTPAVFAGSDVYKIWDTTKSKNSAYSSGVIQSEFVFGGYLRILDSQFCINSYDSTNVKRSFETDGVFFSQGAYLCHNCENIDEGILCFNAKNLRYAVGNCELKKPEYDRIKKMLLDYLNGELGKTNEINASIFSIPKGT